jgi:hypothetical protein
MQKFSGRLDSLIGMVRQQNVKQSFVDAAGAAGAAGGMPPGGDPMAGGDPAAMGMPPGGDPAAMGMPPGGDPMAGGMPPGDPMAGGGDPMAMLQPMIQQAVQQAMAAQGGGMGAGGEGGIKPKIDVNVELMQIKNMLAKLVDQAGIQMPAQEMVATEQGLNEMAASPGADPSGGGGGGGSAIGGIEPMQGASPALAMKAGHSDGDAYDSSGLFGLHDKASALARLAGARRATT